MVGEPPEFDFEPRDHLEIGTALGLIEMEAAAQASGSRFAYLLGDLVMVELALVRFALELAAGRGPQAGGAAGAGRARRRLRDRLLPGEREQIYEMPRDELFLVGTSEVTLAALHADEILEPGTLPLRYAGFSTCFRREAGAAGKDTRGIFRVHQFDKVEMYSFVEPEDSARRARAAAGAAGAHPGRAGDPLPRGQHRRSATSARRRRRSTTARRGSPARAATGS